LGAIGVIELKDPVDVKRLQPACVDRGIWVRPFAHNFYVMPPYIMRDGDLAFLTSNMVGALAQTLGE
jgi:adenosylmethionine-8-amino-7-oxononanoate aminotransferase